MDVWSAGTGCLLVAVARGTLAQPQSVHEANRDGETRLCDTAIGHHMSLYQSQNP